MSLADHKSGLWPSLLLAGLLIAAQLGAIAHAHAHEPGTPQNNVCATCATATQLGSACIDGHGSVDLAPQQSAFHVIVNKDARSTATLVTRQRGPPHTL